MNRTDLIDRVIAAIRDTSGSIPDCKCAGCGAEIEFDAEHIEAERLIDALDRDGLEIVKK